MRLLSNVLVVGLAVYAGLSLFLYLFQDRFVYFPELPSREVDATPTDAGLAFEPLQIRTEDNETLDGWFIPAAAAKGTLLYLHGNGGNIGHRVEIIKTFHDLGLNVLIFDYRGYGRSTGSPTEQGTYRDAMAAWRYLNETRHIPARDILYYGESLGGPIAAWLAERHSPRALVLYAAFTSIPEMAQKLYPFLPAQLLARYRYDTRAALARVHCPVFIMHSAEDEIVPFEHGRALLAVAPEPRQLVVLQGGHNDALFISRETYVPALEKFLQKIADDDASRTSALPPAAPGNPVNRPAP